MPQEIYARLRQLEARRKGTDRLEMMAMDARSEILAKSIATESWQERAPDRPFTRYAVGAMQEVGQDYTSISLETARRVGNQLQRGLTTAGFSVDFRLQGSVPLNVHIRGVSDVDLLSLDVSFFTYASAGVRSLRGNYIYPTTRTSLGVLRALRAEAEKILTEKYPSATVDCKGGKAIKLSGGSLPRSVDVVPSHWHDGENYQISDQEYDRTVTIMDASVPTTLDNRPFLHIKRVNDQDYVSSGGLKKAIRLCKNVKSDSENDISLSSFDIASIMYHADQNALSQHCTYELAVLAETQRFLDLLYHNKEYAKTLRVPDGSRAILDTESKFGALTQLSVEMDSLLRDVTKEQNNTLARQDMFGLDVARNSIASIYIP